MTDNEVLRLRQLRNTALKIRTVARALESTSALRDDAVLEAVACSAWRLARTISGRLISHPCLSYQRGPTAIDLVSHSVAALGARITPIGRSRALRGFAVQLRRLAREVADARALTWTLELSDSFARSQAELSVALRAIELEVGSTHRSVAQYVPVARASAVLGSDHPYLAF